MTRYVLVYVSWHQGPALPCEVGAGRRLVEAQACYAVVVAATCRIIMNAD